ncbi:hypothetical protein [Niameybacter massiliensis]|uniref:hypothetical protein n=1 Tax=Niameybacter massiliensis TaxID=1658108 RepID=UPI0018E1E1E1|nr:hypothetical protein [Niameybacter massiliensis]
MMIRLINLLVLILNVFILILNQLPKDLTQTHEYKNIAYMTIIMTIVLILADIFQIFTGAIFKILGYSDELEIASGIIAVMLSLGVSFVIFNIPYVANILNLLK